jgi:hypothetical protein
LCRRGCGGGSLSFGKAQVEARRGRRHFLVSVRSTHRILRRLPVKVVVSIGFEMTVVTYVVARAVDICRSVLAACVDVTCN